MAQAPIPIEIFCSYAHADEKWLRKLETHLRVLKQQGLISLWHDRVIMPGADWAKTIDTHLETASVILLLVSADFLASDYCYSIEMKRALERHEANEARVISVLVRPVNWSHAPFAHLQALPTDAKPLTSWQDEDTALADITAGIRRVIVEELPQISASVPRTALPAIWNIPYPRNPFFLGRDGALAQIRHHLQGGLATALAQPQAISGLGGIGKTQLALEYAYRYYQDYQVVLWARAESTAALVSSYIAIASLLRLPEREAEEQDAIVQAVKTWLQTHRGWLLILDNADELGLLAGFLPPILGGHLLLTTLATATGRLAQRLEIATFLPEDGALFLLRRAAVLDPAAPLEHASGEERELALRISQELDGLPLALDQVGAYLEETGMDLDGYWHLYQQHRAALLRERRGLVADHPESVSTTWSLSFQRVEDRNPAAAELLRLCAYLSPNAIAEEILTIGAAHLGPVLAPIAADAFLLNQAIEALRAYSLVQRDTREKSLSVHRLVRAILLDTLDETQQRTWAGRVLRAVNAAFPDVEYRTWPQCERVLPQAMTVADLIKQYQLVNGEAGRLLYKAASYLRDRARYAQAESLFKQGVKILERYLGPDHPDMITPLTGLAILYRLQNKYAQAEPLFQQALHIWEQQLGPDHTDATYALNGLAILYRLQGKYAQAEPLFQRVLHIWELGPDHPRLASPLNNLAILYREQGKYAQAEPLFQRALHIWEQQVGRDHPWVATPLTGLADLYREQGKYAQAEPLYQRALQIRQERLGSDHSQVAYPLTGLANLYRKQGKYAQAEPLYQQALQIRENQLGLEHPRTATVLAGLANLYREQGKYAQAEPLFQRALHIWEQQVGRDHPETAEIMQSLAQLCDAQGNSEEARVWYTRTLAIREQMLGAHHPKTTETRKPLIALLRTLGHNEEAARLEAIQSEA